MKNATFLFSAMIIAVINACASPSGVYTFTNEKGETVLSVDGQQTLLPEVYDTHTISLLSKEIRTARKEAEENKLDEKEIEQEVNRAINDFFATKENYNKHSEYLADKDAEQIISRKIKASNITEINTDIPVDIYYTQGDTTSVELKGIAYMLNRLEAKVEKSTLNLRLMDKYKNGINATSIECYITSPILSRISGKSVCNFHAKETARFKDFTFIGSGVNNINFADLYCENFILKNSGVCNSSLNIKKADKVLINSSGAGEIELNADCTELSFQNTGRSDINATTNCDNFILKNSGVCNSTLHIKKADEVLISTSGTGKIQLKVNCKELSFHNSGRSSISATVDCQTLQASNSGVGKITLSGIADKVDIKNSGRSNIDMSKLNK